MGLTVDRLVRGAAELADEVGVDKVTVSALARRFGVKDASLYSHIRSAQDLKERLALLALAEMADVVAEALAGRAGKDALMAFANAYRAYATRHPGRHAAAQLRLSPELLRASAAKRHSDMTRALLRGYGLTEPDQTDAIRMLHSTFYGYVALETAGAFDHTPRETSTSWNRTLDALDTTLRNWPN